MSTSFLFQRQNIYNIKEINEENKIIILSYILGALTPKTFVVEKNFVSYFIRCNGNIVWNRKALRIVEVSSPFYREHFLSNLDRNKQYQKLALRFWALLWSVHISNLATDINNIHSWPFISNFSVAFT